MTRDIQVEVSEEHIDELGHLNHVKSLAFLEQARIDWYAHCGLWEKDGEDAFGTIVVNLNVNFRKECFLGETLTVRTQPISKGTKSFILSQEIIRPDGETAIDAQATNVVMEMATRKIIPVPEPIASHLPSPS